MVSSGGGAPGVPDGAGAARRAGGTMAVMAALTLAVVGAVVPAVGAGALVAQEAPALEPGRTVRITSPALVHRTAEGTLVERSAASLLLRPEGSAAPVELEIADVRRIQVATGSHRGTLRGAFTGLWSGLVLGVIIYGADEADDEIDPDCGELQCFEAPFFLAMSLGGAAVGAAVGSLFHVTEWADVPVARLGVSAGLEPSGSQELRQRRGRVGSSSTLELRIELAF